MGKMKNTGLKFIFCFAAGIISGTIIGSTMISMLVSYRMDSLYEKIAILETTIDDREEKLEKLENAINNANYILKDIEIIINFSGDELDNIEIQKIIKEKYNSLLGKKVKELDADLLVQIIDKRILKMNEDEYKLSVNKLILSEILKIWIDINPSS